MIHLWPFFWHSFLYRYLCPGALRNSQQPTVVTLLTFLTLPALRCHSHCHAHVYSIAAHCVRTEKETRRSVMPLKMVFIVFSIWRHNRSPLTCTPSCSTVCTRAAHIHQNRTKSFISLYFPTCVYFLRLASITFIHMYGMDVPRCCADVDCVPGLS